MVEEISENKTTVLDDLTKEKLDTIMRHPTIENSIRLTDDERTKAVHLYQYVLDSKTGIVRDELYEYFILRSIYDHGKEKPLNKKEIIKHIEQDYNFVDFPEIHINSALQRLQTKNLIIGKEIFSLPQDKITEIKQNNQTFIQFMETVLSDLEAKISSNTPELPTELVKTTVKNFYKLLGKTFTIHGKIAARIIANKIGTIETLQSNSGFKKDYQELVLDLIPEHLQDKISEIFNDFFFNPTKDQSAFFFAMTQSHTLLEILNIDPELKKIEENALKKTKIFLDTNVIIYLLFEGSMQGSSIKTVIEHSKQLGASLYINKITKIEFDSWLDNNKKGVARIKKIPEKLSEALFSKKIDAPLFTSYMNSLRNNPHQTIDQFCLKFEDITKILSRNYGIELDDSEMEEYITNEFYTDLESEIQKQGYQKSPMVVKHDALCILKVKQYRKTNPSDELGPKAWFLTTDSSLIHAEKRIFPEGEIRASITATLWLQILSPLISPKLRNENTSIGFSKLLSMNFGMNSIIHQEDILNITAAFYDDKTLSVEEFKEVIGDKHVRDSLKKVHEAHLRQDQKEEERWTKISLSTVTTKLKGKHEQEIDGYKKSLQQFTKRLDNQDGILTTQSQKLDEQLKLIESLKDEKKESKWKSSILLKIIISIGIAIVIPTLLYLVNLITKTSDILTLIGIEAVCIVGIFVPWIIYHKMKLK